MNSTHAQKNETSILRQLLPDQETVTRSRRRLHHKAFGIAAVATAGYLGLVLAPVGVVGKMLCAVVLVHGLIAIATGIMHDANHHAFSSSKKANQVLSYTADLLGANSWMWQQQHNILHHHHTNVMGVDGDIEQQPFARLAPDQELKRFHRYQHVYMWPLYGFLTIKWFLVGDFVAYAAASNGTLEGVRKPSGATVAKMTVGKLVHLLWAIGIPMLMHSWWVVLLVYLACSWSVGFALAVIFQLAHCVDRAQFVADDPSLRLTGASFLRHQLATTVNISSRTRAGSAYMRWLMGGLDHQVEHHLAPRLPHTVYPTMSETVKAACVTEGVEYKSHTSFRDALGSHTRWLQIMGRQPSK